MSCVHKHHFSRSAFIALVMLCACGPAAVTPEPAETRQSGPTIGESTVDNGVEIRWQVSAAAHGTALDVQYAVRNRGKEPLLLGDQLLRFGQTQGFDRAPTAMIVYPDSEDPTLVHFARGRVAPPNLPQIEVMPATRAFAPGAELTGTARLPLPVKGWHPNGEFYDLPVTPTRAVLELGVAPGASDTDPWPLSDGQTIDVLDGTAGRTTHRLARGAEIALPAPR